MNARALSLLILSAFFALFMIYPLADVIGRAFFVEGKPSLQFFYIMLGTPYYREVVLNSLNIALAVTALTSLIAYPIAFVMARARLRLAPLLHALLLLPLVVPPFVGVLGLRQIFGRFGTVNVLLLDWGILTRPIDFLGSGNVAGIVALQVIHLVPILYLSIRASLANVHVALEEAAVVSGASKWTVLRRVVLPLSYPGWFAGAVLVFVASFTDLGTPLVFEYRHVLPVQIFNMLSDLNENPVGYSFVVFACTVCAALFYLSKDTVLQGSFAGSARASRSSQGKNETSVTIDFAITSTLLAYCAICSLPHIAVGFLAFSGQWFMTPLPELWTLDHMREVWSHPLTARSLINSLCLSGAAAVLSVFVGGISAYLIVRTKGPSRALLDLLTLLPLAVPGIVFAFGYIGAFAGTILDNRINPFPLLIAAYIVRRTPTMVRTVTAGLQEIPPAYEEAGAIAGASAATISKSIVLPLVQRHVVVGALLTFAYSMLEVSDSLLLAMEDRFYPVSKAMYVLMARPDGVELASALGLIVMALMVVCFIVAELVSGKGFRRAIQSILIAVTSALTFFSTPHTSYAESRELVLVSPHWEGIKTEFEEGFKRAIGDDDIRFRWLDVGGTSDIVRYIRTQFGASPQGIGIDLLFGGGTDPFIDLEHDGLLMRLDLNDEVTKAIPPHVGGVPLYSKERLWYAAALSTFGILYNRVAVERAGLPVPATWRDLSTPPYHGLVGAGDPRKSGSMHAMYETVLQGYGWDEGWRVLRGIARNVRNFSGGATQVGKEIASGEIAYGFSIDTYAGELIRSVGSNRLGYVVPSDYPTVSGDSIGALKGAPNKELARQFVEFVLSERGQRIWYGSRGTQGGPAKFELGKLPILPSLYGSIPTPSVVEGSPFTWSAALPYDAKLGGERWAAVNDLFGVFIIDVHSRLTEMPLYLPVPPLPIIESEISNLLRGSSWSTNPALRSALLEEWGEAAREQLPPPEGSLSRFRAVPAAIFLAFLTLSAIVRVLRSARTAFDSSRRGG